ncbi:hypothetical protein ABPG75_001390 [Micractinium tetrahymenae]
MSTLCALQVGYLCTSLRPVIDAGFQGDVAAMQHIITQHLAAAEQQPQAEQQQAEGGQRQRQQRPTRGIVLAVGGGTYAANAFVNLWVLRRHLNCTLPVAIMYWGASRLDAINNSTQAFLREHISDLQLIDASRLPYPGHHRRLFPPGNDDMFNGWKVKMFALYAAPFDEVLILDGDSTPLQDPAPLFEHPAFRRHGVMAWPDNLCERVVLYRQVGVEDPWRGARYGPWQGETGQLLLSRRMHPDVLEWLLFLNTHDEFTYFYSYGDKDTLLAAFQLAGKAGQFYQASMRACLSSPTVQGKQAMRVLGFLQHAPDLSLAFLHRAGPFGRKYDPAEDEAKPLSHVMVQPSCQWNSKRAPFGPTVAVPRQSVHPARRCRFDLGNVSAALAACGVPETPGKGLQKGLLGDACAHPPVFEVGEATALAELQRQSDAAFAFLRAAKKRDASLFQDEEGGQL